MAILSVSPDSICAGLGVVVVEAVDLDLVLALVRRPSSICAQFDVGLADQPEALVAGALLLQVLGQQVGVHLRLEQRHAGHFGSRRCPWRPRDRTGRRRKRSCRASGRASRLLPGQLDLALFQRGVLGAEGDTTHCARGVRSLLSFRASACSQRVPASGSTREKSMCWPPLPRMPVFSSSSRHSAWRSVSPERAMDASAVARRGCSSISSSDFTVGAGTASTVNGPVTRTFGLSTCGWS